MSAQGRVSKNSKIISVDPGATIVALSGLGLVVYGIMFIIRNFTGFIELGLTPEQVGESPQQIMAFSQNLYHYISHLHIALAGTIIALGLAVIALAWFGIRRGELWAVWTALIVPVVAMVIAIPLHYPYGFATFGHLGLIYLDVVILVVGTIISYRAIRSYHS